MTTTTDMSTLLRRQSSVIFASVSIEEPLCNYLSKFDGTKKNFSDIRPEFDALFSQNFIHLGDGRHTMDKNTFICMTKHLLEQQMVASVEDLYFVDDTHVEYTVHWCNGETGMVVHVEAVVADGKIVKITPCVETRDVYAKMFVECHKSSTRLDRISNRVQEEWKRSQVWRNKHRSSWLTT